MANLKDLLVNGVTRFIGKVYAPTPEAGDNSTQVATTAFVMENAGASDYHPTLFDFKYSDKLINDIQWLRSDTFSWQDGSVYVAAYNKLVEEYNDASGTTVTEGSITFKRTPNGYKIALADQENAILNKYNSNGIAWYYILDTTNQRFKLPRTKFGFEGLRTNVGDDIGAGLPNITGYLASIDTAGRWGLIANASADDYNKYSGAFAAQSNGPYTQSVSTGKGVASGDLYFDASRSNPIYGNSDTVQPPATQMYLYFYVGEYTESAEAQTAGLNSELFNGKLDINGSNLSAQGRSYFSGFGMPSANFENQTVGASGAIYSAPANGWYCGSCVEGGVRLENTSANNFGVHSPQTVWSGGKAYIPCQKGDKISFGYAGTTVALTFYYAEGEAPSGGTTSGGTTSGGPPSGGPASGGIYN